MNSHGFRQKINIELASWHDQLLQVTDQIDHLASIDKFKMQPQIEALHILLTELEDRLNQFETSSNFNEWLQSGNQEDKIGEPSFNFKETPGVNVDYDFGG